MQQYHFTHTHLGIRDPLRMSHSFLFYFLMLFTLISAHFSRLMCGFSSKIPFGKRIGIPGKINTKYIRPRLSFVKQNQTEGLNLRTDLPVVGMKKSSIRKTGLRCFWSGGGVIFYNEFFTIPVYIYLLERFLPSSKLIMAP